MEFRLTVLVILGVLPLSTPISVMLSDSLALSPSRNTTLVSRGDTFELGFFNPSKSGQNRWYVGIWYKNDPERRRNYVWVANRDKPLYDLNGTLQISGGELAIRSGNNNVVWSPQIIASGEKGGSPELVAELLDTGNFVVRYSQFNDSYDYLWQSFDYPTATLIPGMILGVTSSNLKTAHLNRVLTAWKDVDDPSTGDVALTSETQGLPGLDIKLDGGVIFRSGPWDGEKFIRLPRIFNVTANSLGDTSFLYVGTNDVSSPSILHINPYGNLIQLRWNEAMKEWEISWSSTTELCDVYNYCGVNSYCDMNLSSKCSCIEGFERDPNNMTHVRCMRKAPLNCGGNDFSPLVNMSLPQASRTPYRYIKDEKGCRKKCTEDCACTAFSVTNILQFNNSPCCIIWHENLSDVRRYSDKGLDLHIKVKGGNKETNKLLVIGLPVGIAVLLLLAVAVYFYCKRKRRQMRRDDTRTELISTTAGLTPPMPFGVILQATENFSNEIGHGGFGKVYKGRLLDGQEIAAKKLSKMSRQGIHEFRTEIELITNLQHINLVRLVGWTAEEEDMVLVYEYLENGSLETHLFGVQSSGELTWQTRYEIIKGIARGLAYLHEGSRFRTIHRDLKPENILLNRDFVPKISDFGLARIFERNDHDAVTTHPAGTRGYMSPEYYNSGIYSPQSDTFSFGVMLLEILSGKKNTMFSYSHPDTNLPSFVWTNWKDGNWQESVDEVIIRESLPSPQVLRSMEIGLLCVQQVSEDRPSMSTVVYLLENETLEVPRPNPPGFFMFEGQSSGNIPTSSSKTYGECSTSSASANQRTMTEITPR